MVLCEKNGTVTSKDRYDSYCRIDFLLERRQEPDAHMALPSRLLDAHYGSAAVRLFTEAGCSHVIIHLQSEERDEENALPDMLQCKVRELV
jgi:hypothetical protein